MGLSLCSRAPEGTYEAKMKFVKLLAKVMLGLLLVLALAALVLYRWLQEPPKVTGHEEIERLEGVAVEVERPGRRDFVDYLYCDGTVEARVRSVLRAQIAETVEAVHVDVGDPVEQGQLLLEFRKTDLEAEVQARRTAYEEAKNNYQRYQVLLEEKVVSRNVVEARRTAMQAAAASLQRAESEMKYTQVRAPIGDPPGKPQGRVRVAARYVELGEHMSIGDTLLMLVDLSQMEVCAQVPVTGISLCNPGTTALFKLEGEQCWRSGPVVRVSPSTENPNRFYQVFIQATNERSGQRWLMRAGMYAAVRFVRAAAQGALSVRASAVRREGRKEYLFVVQRAQEETVKLPETRDDSIRARLRRLLGMAHNGKPGGQGPVASARPGESSAGARKEIWKAHRVEVQTGLRAQGYVQLLGDAWSEDDLVVASPREEMYDGIKVRIVKGEKR